MPRSQEIEPVLSTALIFEERPLHELNSDIRTIAVDEVLTLEVQRDKLSANCISLIAAGQNQIAVKLPESDALQAAQIVEKMASVHSTLQGKSSSPFTLPNFAQAKRIRAAIEIEN